MFIVSRMPRGLEPHPAAELEPALRAVPAQSSNGGLAILVLSAALPLGELIPIGLAPAQLELRLFGLASRQRSQARKQHREKEQLKEQDVEDVVSWALRSAGGAPELVAGALTEGALLGAAGPEVQRKPSGPPCPPLALSSAAGR